MIDAAGFRDLKSYIKRRVAYARYRVGSNYYRTLLNKIEITGDGTVRIWVPIIPYGQVTVTRVELWSNNQEMWMHQDCNITIDTGQTGILYWFDINITEQEEN